MLNTIINQFEPDYSIHPGEVLKETLKARGIQKTEFAERCGISLKTISQIVNNKATVTPETALQFERVLGVAADIWNNLDSKHKLFLARSQKKKELESLADWVSRFPIAELRKRGILSRSRDRACIAEELLQFFGVANVDAWREFYGKLAVAFRKSKSFESSAEAVAAWLRFSERIGEGIEADYFDSRKFRGVLTRIRSLTKTSPCEFEPRMKEWCKESGVVLILVTSFPKARISGATRWLANRKAMIALTLRYKTDDQFWFSFFHEAGHILLHERKRVFIDAIHIDNDTLEHEANEFARDFLIPSDQYRQFVASGRFYKEDIISFADRISIAPGIIVGLLQHEKLIDYRWHNDLKQKFELVEN